MNIKEALEPLPRILRKRPFTDWKLAIITGGGLITGTPFVFSKKPEVLTRYRIFKLLDNAYSCEDGILLCNVEVRNEGKETFYASFLFVRYDAMIGVTIISPDYFDFKLSNIWQVICNLLKPQKPQRPFLNIRSIF